MDSQVATETVRSILEEHGRLSVPVKTLSDTDDLYRAGLTSHATVSVMLACEDAFDLEFTADLLTKQTFTTIETIAATLVRLDEPAGSVA